MLQTMIVPLNTPVTQQDIDTLLIANWTYVGQFLMTTSKGKVGLVTPENPTGGIQAVPCHLFKRDTGTMPTEILAQALLDIAAGHATPQAVCASVFNMSIGDLKSMMEKQENDRQRIHTDDAPGV